MAIDAGIYSQIQQPQQPNQLATLAQAYQIKNLQRQGDQADMAAQQQNKLLQLVGGQDFQQMDTTARASALQGVGAFEQAGNLVRTDAAAGKDKREGEKFQLEGAIKKMETMGQIMGAVKDQASYDIARQQAAQIFGPDMAANIPPVYNPAEVAQKQQQALAMKDRMTMDLQRRGQDVTMRGQDLSQSTALRGQDLSRQTSLETNANSVNATTRGQDLVNQRALDAQGKGAKLTEDQGKATGWLVQAENAFKNMQAAGFDEKGNPLAAAKPGIADAISNIPLVGGAVGNSLRTADRQKFVQGASSLSESLLRAATGAGVNKDEAKQKIEELTPQWGEDAATTKQKMAAIPLYIESLKVRAGPGASQAEAIGAGTPKPAGLPQKRAPQPDLSSMEAELKRRGLLK